MSRMRVMGIGLFTLVLSCSGKESPKGSVMENPIAVRAILLSYTPNAMSDTFDDGRFESFDATKLRILAPAQFAGRELNIHHGGEVPRDSVWRAVGQRVLFDIDLADLGGGQTLFEGAVTSLRVDTSANPADR